MFALPCQENERVGVGIEAEGVVVAQGGLNDGVGDTEGGQGRAEVGADVVDQVRVERLAEVHPFNEVSLLDEFDGKSGHCCVEF